MVVLSSRAHFGARDLPMDDLNWERRRYSAWPAYNASKLCNLLFAKELARRTREAGDDIEVFALHPGVIGTSLFSGESLSNFAVRIAKAIPFFPLLKSPEQVRGRLSRWSGNEHSVIYIVKGTTALHVSGLALEGAAVLALAGPLWLASKPSRLTCNLQPPPGSCNKCLCCHIP